MTTSSVPAITGAEGHFLSSSFFFSINRYDYVISTATAIADLLNNPPKGNYNMVDLWGDDPRALILFRPLDGVKTVAYPIMSTAECKDVITTISGVWAD